MNRILFNAVSGCCEGLILPTLRSISAIPSRQPLRVSLTSGRAGTRNTDEYEFTRGRTHSLVAVSHVQNTGQQV